MTSELTDAEIAERMLKLFDGGVHWTRGSAHRPAYDEHPEQWCLIGAYRRVAYGSQQVSIFELDNSPFVQKLVARIENKYPRYSLAPQMYLVNVITSANDYDAESYEDIRQILEEVISSEQAECGSEGDGTAPD